MSKKTQSIVTIIGPLAQTLPYIKPETILHADELNNRRKTKTKLREELFIAGDFPFYRCENVEGQEESEAFLYLARAPNNLIFQHPDQAIPQLLSGDHNYRPAPRSIDEIVRDPNTLKIQLSKLNLKGDDKEWKYVEINTTNYATLNDEERKLTARIYGSMQSNESEATGQDTSDFAQNMATLKENNITPIRIDVLAPEYVKEYANDTPIARAGFFRVDTTNNSVMFVACYQHVNHQIWLRGICQKRPPAPRQIKNFIDKTLCAHDGDVHMRETIPNGFLLLTDTLGFGKPSIDGVVYIQKYAVRER